jgi:hypothetical protein
MQTLLSPKHLRSILLSALIAVCSTLWAGDFKTEDIVAKHLESIGPAQARQGLKSRVVQGGATYRVIVGGSGAIDGKYVFA